MKHILSRFYNNAAEKKSSCPRLFFFFSYDFRLMFWHFSDTQNRLLSCGSAPRKSCNWCRWIDHLLWLWHDGRDQNIYSSEIAWSLLFCVWERCKKGIILVFHRLNFKLRVTRKTKLNVLTGYAKPYRSWSTSTHWRSFIGNLIHSLTRSLSEVYVCALSLQLCWCLC